MIEITPDLTPLFFPLLDTELIEKLAVMVVKLFTLALTKSNTFLALGSFCACALTTKRTTIKSENNFFMDVDFGLIAGKDRF